MRPDQDTRSSNLEGGYLGVRAGPISAWSIGACGMLILAQIVAYIRRARILPHFKGEIGSMGEQP